MAVEVLGFESFSEMKDYFKLRYRYIKKIETFISDDRYTNEMIMEVWNEYKKHYYRMTE